MSSGNTENATTPTTSSPAIQRPRSSSTMLWAVIGVVIVIVILVGALWATGVIFPKSKTSGCAPGSSSVTGAGSTLVYPLMYYWGKTYHDASVNYESVGSGAGITAITGLTVNYGASDAPLNPAQRAAVKSPLITLPESAGAVVPIYNVPGLATGTVLQFTGSVLAQIFMGNITNWHDPALVALNPSANLPNASIVPVVRSDGSGTTFIYSSYLSQESATFAKIYGHSTLITWPKANLQSKGNSGVAATVQTTTDAVGYVDINYAASTSLAYGKVQNPAGNYIQANVSNAASAIADSNVNFPAPTTGDWYNFSVLNAKGAQDYPITSFTYVLLYQDPGKAYNGLMSKTTTENLVDFLWWAVTQGQQYSPDLFYVPLPSTAVTFDESELNSVTYNGAAVSVCTTTS
jgi:phosphate transport system substrate-binding protein